MGMLSATVQVKDIAGLDATIAEVMDAMDANLKDIAEYVEREAQTTLAYHDKTGMLRKKTKLKVSKYEDGGYIVQARAPHAHLVEYGHVAIPPGKLEGGRVPPHPFMRPALENGVVYAILKLREQTKKG
ncbi:MAG: HK97 gp10 family phage protein [Deltaproteobacteria bacterium]|nr:HK97 gp10 family phage protein [Pseudomonadota bacterium]NCD26764.1 HK97 gp10 family phage protein [Deltaproteobacteria bacterium]